MAKATANTASEPVADSNDTEEASGPMQVAEWVGSEKSPRVDGRSVRRMTKADVKKSLVMELTRDLEWGPATAYRVDISNESESFKEWIGKQKEFKVTEES